ncbi:rod shape-determining protein RodA [Candidatus Saganbacteria bacterium CG08_land_8_20_14_0_20_45_16]|uniref:Peptidoglycan glycosyltransferase RodA n=1 Tax=Candidatus Saganbacteria bacterium CG08_land_8_20_14_0_20_45_16 TaxID=2014293 RepID=A0A2H0XZI2_UNCSA|nr:MAG: rod shape-determining protein RodA [Candidatus Saganbacteria bacterium CG08_land_8_20_14_0_20_45_16]
MINFRLLKASDLWLWLAASGLVLFGFFAIFSSSFSLQMKFNGDPLLFVKRQFISFIVGGLGLIIFAYLDYKRLKKLAPYFYIVMLIFLGLVLFGGSKALGAQRWFQIGPFSFQPSEVSKIFLVIALAAFFSVRTRLKSIKDVGELLAMVGLPFLLIFKQPDLGTALVLGVILIGMLAVSGASPKLLILLTSPIISIMLRPFIYLWLIYLVIVALILFLTNASWLDWFLILGLNILVGIAMPIIWSMLKAYQKQRILAFLNPAADPFGAGYHTLQSKIAIGSGGFWGKGFLHGTQTQLQFIPEQHSDFIFSVIGEEFGFLGGVAVLGLFGLFVWRALTIASEVPDLFGAFLASGIAVMTAFHMAANIGMTVGLLPVVGMPLPFVSFGGSSLLMNMISLGILQSLSMRRQKLIF